MAQQQVTLTVTAQDGGTLLAVTQGLDKLIQAAERAGKTPPIAPKVDPSGVISLQEHFSNLTFGIQKFARVWVSLQVIMATVASVMAVRTIVEAADAWLLMAGRLRLVTDTAEEAATVQRRLLGLANEIRTPLQSTAELYTRLALNTQALNLSQSTLLSFTKAVGQALLLSGATAEEASGGIIQFTQAMAEGRLHGQELRAVLNEMPRLAKALADGLILTNPAFKALVDGGMSANGALRQFGESGKLVAALTIPALATQFGTLNKEFALLPVTSGQAMQQIKNDLTGLAGEADIQPLVQAIEGLRTALADPELHNAMLQMIQDVIDLTAAGTNVIPTLLDLFNLFGRVPAAIGLKGIGLTIGQINDLAMGTKSYSQILKEAIQNSARMSKEVDIAASAFERLTGLEASLAGILTGKPAFDAKSVIAEAQAETKAIRDRIAAKQLERDMANLPVTKKTDTQLLEELKILDKETKAKIELIRLDGLLASGGVKTSTFAMEAILKEADANRTLLSGQQAIAAQMTVGSKQRAEGDAEIAGTRLKVQQLTLQYHALNAEIAMADIARSGEIQKAQIAAYAVGAEAIQKNAALEITTAQQTFQVKHDTLAKVLTDETQLNAALSEDAKNRDTKIIVAETNKFKALHDLAVHYVMEFIAIEKSRVDLIAESAHQSTEIALKELDIEGKARQLAFDAGKVSLNELVEAEKNASDQRAGLQLADLAVARSAILEKTKLAQQELAVQFGPRTGMNGEQILGDTAKLNQGLLKLDVDTQKQLQANTAATEKVKQDWRERDLPLTAKLEEEKYRILGHAADQQLKLSNETAQKILDDENSSVKDRIRAEATLFGNLKKQYDQDVQEVVDAWAKKRGFYQSETEKQLAIESGKFTLEKTLYDKSVQDYINAELKKTGYLQDALTKRLAEDAGYIQSVESIRQKLISDAATVLTQQARLAGDLGAAFQVGFAEAATAADDAFKSMAKAGADTYNSLKSGASDFLYEIISTSGKIGDVMLNLGKRILRTMTDAFAEIAVKWAMTAAGLTLPTLLGTGTAIAGAAVGFEGAPNQAATAVKAMADSAQTASGALGGMAQVSGVVSGVFGSLGSLLLTLGSVIFGVIKLLASIMTAGGLGGGIGAAGSGLLSNLGSVGSAFSTFSNLIMGKLADTIQSVFNAFGGSGVFSGALGPAGGAGVAANLLADAIPIAGGLIQIALAAINGNISGAVGGAIGGGIGAFFGGPVGFAIGEMIGSFIGSLLGGLFSGPTPEISGMVKLNSTTLAALQAAQFSGVQGIPGKDNFSFSYAGPLYEEMYKHRTEGNLNREDTQQLIIGVILKTLQEAFAGLDRLSIALPSDLKSKLSDRINSVLAAGFQITDFKFKDSDVGDMLASFKAWLTGLSGNVLQTVVKQVFGNIDLSALGAGDAAKGFDALMQAMNAMGAVFKALDGQVDLSKLTLEQFASGSVTFFQQFAKDGEAFTDTITRVTQALSGILTLRDSIQTEIAGLTNDTAEAMAIVTSQLDQAKQNVVALADAFTVAAESMAPPDEVLAKAQAVKDAIVQTLQAEIALVTKLHDAVVQLQTDITNALTFLGQLTTQINALSSATPNLDEFLQQAIQAWTMASDNVAARVVIFSTALQVYVAALQQAIAAGGSLTSFQQSFTAFAQALGRGFQDVMSQIHNMSDTKGAIAALQGLAQAIQQGLATAIQATQAYYARLRQAAQDAANAEITALNAQKQQIQQSYQDQISALTDLRNQATALDSTLKGLQSTIKSAQQLFTSLSGAIAQLSGTSAPGVIFNQLLADLPARLAAIRGLTDSQAALTELQALSQEVQTDLQAKIQRIQQNFANLRAAAQAAAQEQITALKDERTAVQQYYSDLKTSLQDAATAHIDALNAEKQAVQDAFTARKDALSTELEMANKWGAILDRVKSMQIDIFNTLAPTHPVTSLREVQAQMVSAFGQFLSARTPESATAVQDLAKQVLDLAKQTPSYELPTKNFQDLAAQIQSMLSAIAGTTVSSRSPVEIQAEIADLTKQEQDTLKSIDDQIKTTNDALQATLKTLSAQETNELKRIDDKIVAINRELQNTLTLLSQQEQEKITTFNLRAAAALAAIQAEVQARIIALQTQEADAAAKLLAIIGNKTIEQFTADIDLQIKDLQAQQVAKLAAIDAQIATVNANLQATLTSLSQQEQSAIQSLQQDAAQWLSQIKGELVNQLGKLQVQEAAAAAQLQQIIGNLSFEAYIAQKQADAAQELHAITYTLKWYLGTLINKLFPGTGIPTAATGMAYVPQDMPVFLHKGERVLTAADNSAFSSGKGAVTVNFAPTVVVSVSGGDSPQRIKQAIDEAVSSLLSGPSRTRAELVRFAREHR